MTSVESGGRVALVTGGATGIGRATCEHLAAASAAVVFVNYAHSEQAARELVTLLSARGTQAIPVQADVTDYEQVNSMLGIVRSEAGRLDLLVNNAGVTEPVPFHDIEALTPQVWDKVWQTNVLGAFWCSRAAADLLRTSHGCIVNVASIAGTRAVGSSLPYSVSKAALLQLTRALAVALAPEVRVNSVSAGTVTTSWHERLVGAEEFGRRAQAEARKVPLQRLAGPQDIAQVVVSLLDADFVTGQDVLVDGGKGLLY